MPTEVLGIVFSPLRRWKNNCQKRNLENVILVYFTPATVSREPRNVRGSVAVCFSETGRGASMTSSFHTLEIVLRHILVHLFFLHM